MDQPRKILIFTTAFGDGHNTAARNIREAMLPMPGVEAKVLDPYAVTNPGAARLLKAGYNFSIQRLPVSWKAIYWAYDRTPLFRWTLPTLAKMAAEIRRILWEEKPDAVVTTYPVYNYLLDRLRRSGEVARFPLFMVVTDSLVINRVWREAPADWVLVSEEATAEVMAAGGVEPAKIRVEGFPVSPLFEKLARVELPPGPPWKVLYLPAAGRSVVERNVRGIASLPGVRLQVVTGRQTGLHDHLRRLDLPMGAFDLTGWTDRMPELLAGSHLFLGKAGGAVVAETLAVRCPVLVSHVVPGQEEGNVTLLERAGAGRLATTPEAILTAVQEAFADGGALWKRWRENLRPLSRPASARRIAEFVLTHGEDAGSGSRSG